MHRDAHITSLLCAAVLLFFCAAISAAASPHTAAGAETSARADTPTGVDTPARLDTPAGATLEVGHTTLKRCGSAAWCGVLPRPLNPTGAVDGTVPIYFEYYPHTAAGAAAGTLVAAEGGPGYATTDSRQAYLALFGPL